MFLKEELATILILITTYWKYQTQLLFKSCALLTAFATRKEPSLVMRSLVLVNAICPSLEKTVVLVWMGMSLKKAKVCVLKKGGALQVEAKKVVMVMVLAQMTPSLGKLFANVILGLSMMDSTIVLNAKTHFSVILTVPWGTGLLKPQR